MKMKRIVYALTGYLAAMCCIAQAAPPSPQQLIQSLKSSDEQVRLQAIDRLGALGAKGAEAVAPLVELLKDASPKVRAHAAQALGAIGPAAKPAAADLVELVKDPDPLVRRQAVRAVMHIRPGPQVMLPLCVKLLEDSDPGVRLRILHAIAEAGPQAMPGLLAALQNDKAAYWACLVLREIGPAAKAAVPALTEKLKDPRPEIRREAALALGAMGSAAAPATGPLAALLDDEHTRIAATLALAEIGQIPEDAEKTIRANQASDNKLLATVSLWALARVHPDDKDLRRKVTEELIGRLKHQDPFVRAAAARALAALPPAPEITAPIWEKALLNADETTLRYALDALAGQGTKMVPRLIEGLKYPKARASIVYILGQIGPDAAPATEALAALTTDKHAHIVQESLVALAKIGPGAKAAVPQLIKVLEAGDEASDAAAYALGRIGPEAAAADAALAAALKSRDLSLTVVAAWALNKIHPASADMAAKTVPVLVAGLSDPLAKNRQAAVEALGELGPLAKDAAAALEKAQGDKDRAVREAAAKALKSVRG
jgi:HEAT repeat protein